MTELAYVTAPDQTDLEAHVRAVEAVNGHVDVVLDRTPFYPQGGGQPSDVGIIEGSGFTFAVHKVVLVAGVVHHQGVVVSGDPAEGLVHARIDRERRAANAALHTAGHLVMTAMFELTGMRAVKGYHFPDGPYVEFEGVMEDAAKATVVEALAHRLDEMVAADEPILVEETTVGELLAAGVFMPAEVPANKPTRVVTTFGYRSPCGGTHVARTGELPRLGVRRVKVKSGHTRVAYELSER
jgi:Ser-tRNA(Ala) deacylase AlaX